MPISFFRSISFFVPRQIEEDKCIEVYDLITECLESNRNEHRRFWVNQDGDIETKDEESANIIADLLEDCGIDVVHTAYDEDLDIWEVYID